MFQDEEKNSVLKSNIWKKLLKVYRKVAGHDDIVAEFESTFSSANAGGNPEEQYKQSNHHLPKPETLETNMSRFRFIVKDRCTSYTSSQRSMMVFQILLRTKYDDTEKVVLCKISTVCVQCLDNNMSFVCL